MRNIKLHEENNQITEGFNKSSFIKNFIWMFSGTGLQAILQSVVLIVLARLLTPADFGLVNIALIIIGVSSIFSSLGVGPAIVQRKYIENRHKSTGFIFSLILGAAISIIIFTFSPIISGFFSSEKLTDVLKFLSIIFIIQSLSVISESLLQRSLKFRAIAITNVVSYAIGYGVIGILMANIGFGVWALVIAHIVQNVIKSLTFLTIQPPFEKFEINFSTLKEITNFGFGYSIDYFSNYVALQADNIVVGKLLGADALGIYGRAYQLMAMPATLLGQVLDKVLFSAMSKIQDQREELVSAYKKGSEIMAITILPISVITIVLAPELINIVLGEKWGAAIIPFQILSAGMLFRTSYKISNSISLAKGAVFQRAWRQAIYAVLVVAGSIIGAKWGIIGTSIGVFFAILLNFIIMANLSIKITGFNWTDYIRIHFPAFLISIFVLIEVFLIREFCSYFGFSDIFIIFFSLLFLFLSFAVVVLLSPRMQTENKYINILKKFNMIIFRRIHLIGKNGGGV